MGDLAFDDTFNIREAVDFLSEKMTLREKLIQSAKQLSEKDGGHRLGVTVKRFEGLMVDFLKLYQPIFERISDHKEVLLRDISTVRNSLAGVYGMIEVARGVEVLADRVRELEADGKNMDVQIKEKTKTIEKLEELLKRVKHHLPGVPAISAEEALPDMFGVSEELSPWPAETGRKTPVLKKPAGRN